MHERAIQRMVADLCIPCQTEHQDKGTIPECWGPYKNICSKALERLDLETKKCSFCKYHGQICNDRTCEEGLSGVIEGGKK